MQLARHLKILSIYFKAVFQYRSRAFVWFLISLINPLLILVYWYAALGNTSVSTWNFSQLSGYYLIQIFLRTVLWTHSSEEIAVTHIQEGELVQFLLKPFSYLRRIFLSELTYRLMQGVFALLSVGLIISIFTISPNISILAQNIPFILLILIFAFCMSFIYEMILGLSAFWLTDFRGLHQLSEVVLIVLTGTVLPLELFPSPFNEVVTRLPFAYMLYYPILAIQGKLEPYQLFEVLSMQILWLIVFILIYKLLWRKGLRIFTGVGQ